MNSRITDLLSVVHSVAKVASKIADSQTQRISRSLPSLSNTLPTLNNTASFGDDSLLRDIQKFNQNDTIDSSDKNFKPRPVVEVLQDKNPPNPLYLHDGLAEEQAQTSELHYSGRLKVNSGAANAGGIPSTDANIKIKNDEDNVKQSLAVKNDLARLNESDTVTDSRSYTHTTSAARTEPSHPRPLINTSTKFSGNTAKLFNEESATELPPIEDRGVRQPLPSTAPNLEKENANSSSADNADQIPFESTQAPKQLREARVPTTRIGRLFQYGGVL
ncbi:hypothetical protein BKA69DRAFT_255756 [Paraphysoderma sedebokerense]|nr:hypothetical protein BKA69DRAFT_255756 [Paraphysoderma sedebokerense]